MQTIKTASSLFLDLQLFTVFFSSCLPVIHGISSNTQIHFSCVVATHLTSLLFNRILPTIAFANRVVAVELNKTLCSAAEENLLANNVHNVHVIPCDSEQFAKKILREKCYTLKSTGEVLNFKTVLVDPPRCVSRLFCESSTCPAACLKVSVSILAIQSFCCILCFCLPAFVYLFICLSYSSYYCVVHPL